MRIDIRLEITDDSGEFEYRSGVENYSVNVPPCEADNAFEMFSKVIESQVSLINLMLGIAAITRSE